MDVERFYTDTGLPAFVKVTKRPKTGRGDAVSLVYTGNPAFDRLWQQAQGETEPKVAEPEKMG